MLTFFAPNRGPEGTCFEGGVFPARLIFPPDYPLSPPKMKFTCEMFHPNSECPPMRIVCPSDVAKSLFLSHFPVFADGRVCISILHAPGDDPMGYELSAERWSPVQSVEKILLSVVSMLAGKIEDSAPFDRPSSQSLYLLEPNDESGANVDAAIMWRDKRDQFNKIAKSIVRKTLGLPS